MYAVIESGGKQYRVELGNEIEVDRLDVEPGQNIRLERVLLVADGDETTIGRPTVEGALVKADVLRQSRGEKLIVFKYKPKARTRVKKGHRADLTVLRIAEIALNGKSAAEEAAVVAAEQKAEKAAADKVAAEKAAADRALAAKLAPQPKVEAKSTARGAKSTAKAADAKPAAKPAAKPKSAAKSTAAGTSSRTQTGEDRAKPARTAAKSAGASAAPAKTPPAQDRASKTTAKAAPDASDAGSTKKDK